MPWTGKKIIKNNFIFFKHEYNDLTIVFFFTFSLIDVPKTYSSKQLCKKIQQNLVLSTFLSWQNESRIYFGRRTTTYTKLKLVHYRSKYLEKSSPLPHLKLAGEFCIGEPGLKINTASAKVFRPLKNQQPEKIGSRQKMKF